MQCYIRYTVLYSRLRKTETYVTLPILLPSLEPTTYLVHTMKERIRGQEVRGLLELPTWCGIRNILLTVKHF